jgi:hypothetical protein
MADPGETPRCPVCGERVSYDPWTHQRLWHKRVADGSRAKGWPTVDCEGSGPGTEEYLRGRHELAERFAHQPETAAATDAEIAELLPPKREDQA